MKRVVTGYNQSGKSVFVSEGPTPRVVTFENLPGFKFEELWSTGPTPSVPTATEDPTLSMSSFVPAPGETLFRFVTFPPDEQVQKTLASADPEAIAMEAVTKIPGLAETLEDDLRMHTTDTVDYGVVVSGDIWLELDDGKEAHLETGDTYVQNGTRHGWSNQSSEPCVVAVVMVGAKRV